MTGLRIVRRPDRDERGAFLVLWALLIVAMLVMVGIVVDLGSYREERRDNRRAADAAAAAGAIDLGSTVVARVAACEKAWTYAWRNLGETPPASPCSAITAPCTTSTVGVPLSATQNGRTVTVLTPVPDNSPLMNADTTGGDTTQAVVPDIDGAPCDRLGVRIEETRSTFFGGLIGQGTHSTDVHTVARRESSFISIPASLVVLEPKGCVAFNQTGTGNVRVLAPSDPDERGGIVVVSDGSRTDNPLRCSGSSPTIDAGGSGDIIVDQPGDIFLQAMSGTICSGTACDPNDVTSGGISPQPLGMPNAAPIGRFLVDHRFNCRSDYTTSTGHYRNLPEAPGGYPGTGIVAPCAAAGPTGSENRDYINTLMLYGAPALQFSGLTPTVVTDCSAAGLALLVNPNAYYDITCQIPRDTNLTVVSAGVRFRNIQSGTIGQLTVTGNAYFDGDLGIGGGKRLTVFGNTYFNGTLNVSGSGLFELRGRPLGNFNTACASAADGWLNWVAAATRLDCLRSSSPDAAWSILNGPFTMTGSSTFDVDRVAVIGRTGAQLDINGNVLWSAPETGPLDHLAFYSDWAGTGTSGAHKVTAGGAFSLEGVFFAPEAEYSIRGSFPTNPQQAQFMSRLFSIAGSGEFRMLPDPEAIQIPVPGGIRLIR